MLIAMIILNRLLNIFYGKKKILIFLRLTNFIFVRIKNMRMNSYTALHVGCGR